MSKKLRRTPLEQQIQEQGFDTVGGLRFLHQTIEMASKQSLRLLNATSPEIKSNDPNQLVTEVDKKIGELIINEIQKRYPNHGIIDEEAGVIEGRSPFVWTIDPVDGTAFLASGDSRWGTMIGLLYNGIPVCGAFFLPRQGAAVFSMEGRGVYIKEGQSITKVTRRSIDRTLRDSIIDFGTDVYFMEKNGLIIPDRKRNDAIAILRARLQEQVRKLESGGNPYGWIQIIRGVYGGSLCYRSSKIWDRVPVHHAIVSLGGVVTEFDGSPVDYKSAIAEGGAVIHRKFGVCAALTLDLHRELQAIIHQNANLWRHI